MIEEPAAQLEEYVADMDPDSSLRLVLKGEKMSGKEFTKVIMLKIGDEATGAERMAGVGFETRNEEGRIFIDNVVFSSAAEKAGVDFDQEILNLQVPTHRLPKELVYIPTLGLYALLFLLQFRRRKKQQPAVILLDQCGLRVSSAKPIWSERKSYIE